MVYQSFLIKYAEIGTKGKNRYLFEDALSHQIKNALKKNRGVFCDCQGVRADLCTGGRGI